MNYSSPLINSVAKIVEHVLKALDMHSPDAFDLVMRTGMQESRFEHLEQIRGPALGFFQVEPDTANDIWYHYLVFKESLRDKLKLLEIPMGPWDDFTIMSNIALQAALCRLHYRRFKPPIPSTIEEQANYWKNLYNTSRGKGKPEEFIANAKELEK